jgi:hypothetical protein
MEDDSLKPTNDAQDKKSSSGIWRFLWRGAMGGVLGVFIFVGYAVLRYPYGIVGGAELPTLLLIATVSGMLVGAVVWLSNRLLESRLRLVSRIILGTLLTVALIALYLYRTEGLEDDLKRFVGNSFAFGLTVGGLAGAMASQRFRNH